MRPAHSVPEVLGWARLILSKTAPASLIGADFRKGMRSDLLYVALGRRRLLSHKQHQSSDRIDCKTGAIVTLDRPPISRLAVECSYSKFWVPIGECVRNRILAHPARSGRITPTQRVDRESPGRRLVFPNCRRHGEPGPRPLLAAARPSTFQRLATRKRVSSTRALSWRCSLNSVTAPMTPEKTTEVGREVHGKSIKPRPPLLAQGSPPRIRFCHPSLTPSPCSTQRRQTACQTGPHIWL